MGTLKLVPNGYVAGSSSVVETNMPLFGGGSHDYTNLADGSDSTGIGGGVGAYAAKVSTYSLAVSGTDIPAGRTVIKYLTAVRGKYVGAVPGTALLPTFKVNVADAAGVKQSARTSAATTVKSSYATTVGGVAPTKANIIAAGLNINLPAANVIPGNGLYQLDTWVEAVYNDIPSAPTSLAYTGGATIGVDNPTFGANLALIGSGQRQKAVWQFATDAAFTANVRLYTEPSSMLRFSGALSSTLPDALKLFPGNWYVRVSAIDEYGLQGPWTSFGGPFTVSHPSSAVQIAPFGAGINWNAGVINFSWNFSDTAAPLDSQTEYQVQVYANGNTTLVLDTGVITSSSTEVALTIPSMYDGIPLSWRVQTFDEAGQSAGYTNYMAFTAEVPPVVTITSVDVDTPAPLIQWTFTSTSGSTEYLYMVQMTDTGTGKLLFESEWINSPDTSFTVTKPVLLNIENVTAAVYVVDSSGFLVHDTFAYTTAWDLPATVTPTIDVTKYGNELYGYVKVTWTNSTIDAQFTQYQVLRRINGTTDWDTIYSTSNIQALYEFDDYLCPAGQTVDYAVIQLALRSGTTLSSAVPSAAVVVTVVTSSFNYWIIDPNNSANNLLLAQVTADSFTDDKEFEVLQLIGRGQKADHGTVWGINGSLTAAIYGTVNKTARQIRKYLTSLSEETTDLYLRNPFGDVWKVDIGTLQIERIAGSGTNEYVTVTIPYSEVS